MLRPIAGLQIGRLVTEQGFHQHLGRARSGFLGSSTRRMSSADSSTDVGQQRQLALRSRGRRSSRPAAPFWTWIRHLGDRRFDTGHVPLSFSRSSSARAAGSRRARRGIGLLDGVPRSSTSSATGRKVGSRGSARPAWRLVALGNLIKWLRSASQISCRLWGGMLVAMPTAMPDAPLASKLGTARRQHHRLAPRSPS